MRKWFKMIDYLSIKNKKFVEIAGRIAKEAAKASICPRRKVGTCIMEVLGDEYFYFFDCNNPPDAANENVCRGEEHCKGERATGHSGCLVTIHSEVRAVLKALADPDFEADKSFLYCTTMPCLECAKVIAQAGIKTVFYESKNELIMNQLHYLVGSIKFIEVKEDGSFVQLH